MAIDDINRARGHFEDSHVQSVIQNVGKDSSAIDGIVPVSCSNRTFVITRYMPPNAEQTCHFTKSGDQAGKLYQSPNTLQYTHVGKSDLLQIYRQFSMERAGRQRWSRTLINSNLVYSGILIRS
jgi:hypothetical protein